VELSVQDVAWKSSATTGETIKVVAGEEERRMYIGQVRNVSDAELRIVIPTKTDQSVSNTPQAHMPLNVLDKIRLGIRTCFKRGGLLQR